jgi:DNA-binding transcriptional LysR family regulator
MDRLDAMHVFAAIVDAGSLSAAGRRLGLPLATVSRKLADLEAHLKTRLVTRSTRHLALTDTGREYLAACRQILEQVDDAERSASGAYASVRGGLVVAAPIVFGRLHVVPVISAFLERHPEVSARLMLSDRNVNLLEDHVDAALRIGELPDSSLVASQVASVRRVVCASPSYLARAGTPVEPGELTRHRCVTFEGLMSASAWSFPGPTGAQRVRIHSCLSVTTADAAIAAAIAGLGVTRVLSYQVAAAVDQGLLTRVLADFEPPAVPVSLVYPGQGRLPMKTRAFIDFAAAQLRSLEI